MKKFVSMFLVLVFTLSMTSIVLAEIRVTLDGAPIAFDVPPQTINDRTMVPLRAIFEALNANIDWNDSTQTVTATRDGVVVVMRVGDPVITVAGNNVTLDVPPQIVNERTLVPARAVAESFGVNVDWNGGTQTVILTTGSGQVTDLTNSANYWVELDGTRFTPGMMVNEFIARGLQVRDRDEDVLNRNIEAFGTLTGFTFAWQDGSTWRTSMQVIIRNTGNEAIVARNARVGQIIIDEQTASAFNDIAFINGIRLGVTTPGDIRSMFGEPTEVIAIAATTALHYYPFRDNRAVNSSLMFAGYRFVFDNDTDRLIRVHLDFLDFAR